MILVTGATGTNGIELIKQLSADGVAVRALVRNPAKAEAIQLPGVELITGDLSDLEVLPAVLQGVSKVFSVVGNDQNAAQFHRNMIDAGKAAGVTHLVKFSVLGAAEDASASFLRDAWQTDQYLIHSGLNYTILRPNAFYQNAFSSFAPTIATDDAFYLPVGEGKVSEVDVRDIAAVAKAILTDDSGTHYSQVYEITGPEALSFGEMAEIISQVLGRPIKYIDVPPQAYQESLLGFGVPTWLAEDLVALDIWYSKNGADKVTNVIEKVAKKAPITYRHFIEDYRSIFK